MQCFFCNNPAADPRTGCEYSARVVACKACTERFWSWFRSHMNGKGKGKKGGKRKVFVNFYDHVVPPKPKP